MAPRYNLDDIPNSLSTVSREKERRRIRLSGRSRDAGNNGEIREDVAAVTVERDGRIQKNGNAAINGAARSEATNKSLNATSKRIAGLNSVSRTSAGNQKRRINPMDLSLEWKKAIPRSCRESRELEGHPVVPERLLASRPRFEIQSRVGRSVNRRESDRNTGVDAASRHYRQSDSAVVTHYN